VRHDRRGTPTSVWSDSPYSSKPPVRSRRRDGRPGEPPDEARAARRVLATLRKQRGLPEPERDPARVRSGECAAWRSGANWQCEGHVDSAERASIPDRSERTQVLEALVGADPEWASHSQPGKNAAAGAPAAERGPGPRGEERGEPRPIDQRRRERHDPSAARACSEPAWASRHRSRSSAERRDPGGREARGRSAARSECGAFRLARSVESRAWDVLSASAWAAPPALAAA